MNLNNRENSTVLAALRYWQRHAINGASQLHVHAEYDIASDGGEIDPLTAEEIDDLCERINCEPAEA